MQIGNTQVVPEEDLLVPKRGPPTLVYVGNGGSLTFAIVQDAGANCVSCGINMEIIS